MDLSRQEYPAVLGTLPPIEAVGLLEERVKQINKTNTEIAEWLTERRRVEESYTQGLRKLVARRNDLSTDFGVFRSPWQSIVRSTEVLALSHQSLAQKMEMDVERPLREYQSKSREMQAMGPMQGNLAALAKDVEITEKKAEKLKTSGKASSNKVANANSDYELAFQQWESQAPYVFEQLQALDESRVNHLRDALTQFQTHELDSVTKSRSSAETCLNLLLSVDTSKEISAFVASISGQRPTIHPRSKSRAASSNATAVAQRPPTTDEANDEPPEPPTLNASRFRAGSASGSTPNSTPTKEKSRPAGFGGLRRLGTVIGRRKDDRKNAERPPSPEKRSRSTLNPLRRGVSSRNMQAIPSPDASTTNLGVDTQPSERDPSHDGSRISQQRESNEERHNTAKNTLAPIRSSSLPQVNGIAHDRELSVQQPKVEEPPSNQKQTEERDADGFSAPPAGDDAISRAQQEAAATENKTPQFKLDIQDEPIQEEGGDVQSAFSNVANTLRVQAQQAATPRKANPNRGRRDVRNTIFVPSGQMQESPSTGDIPPMPSPFGGSSRNPLSTEGGQGSDAQSIRSAHSLNSISNTLVRHPDMHEPGLNASIVETVSASFAQGGQVTKSIVVGEMALVHNAVEGSPVQASDNVRLDNFPVLEKVAPNPTFITSATSGSGEYSVNLLQISKTQVAFKYQVHLEENTMASHVPMLLKPVWKIEANQASVILQYSFNSAFASSGGRNVSLKNVFIFVSVEGAKATGCQSKPAGTFRREKSMIYWNLGSVSLDGYAQAPQKLLARFSTEGEARAGSIEARWEISGLNATGLGSGLGLSSQRQGGGREESGSDPFADGGTSPGLGEGWKEVPVVRKLVSGKYACI